MRDQQEHLQTGACACWLVHAQQCASGVDGEGADSESISVGSKMVECGKLNKLRRI